jgi:tRNA threonylcarbamoyladenosine biosynthesis protein TsaB
LILRVLESASCALEEVQGFGVSIGPGSFTGLRIALGTVKGFAYALGRSVVGVDTLEALACTVTNWEGRICPVLDARKGEIYTALFHRDQTGQLKRESPDLVVAPQEFFTQLEGACLFLGDGLERYGALLRERGALEFRLLPFSSYHPRGGVVARMAWEHLRRGEAEDIGALVPHYVRRPSAEFKRRG